MSNDNPYSEAAFKTLKYAPVFPDRFGSLPDARAFCGQFFSYYNHGHRHSALGLHTPASVHFGTATEIRRQRATTLAGAYAANSAGFRRPPQPPKAPGRCLDQPTHAGGAHSEHVARSCLIWLDTFRADGPERLQHPRS